MSSDVIQVKVVTPEKVALELDATFSKIPGESGEIGIMPNHSATLSALKAGEFIVVHNNQEDVYFISSGLAQITEKSLTVLTPFLEPVSEIDKDRAQAAKDRAKKRLDTSSSLMDKKEVDLDRALKSLRRAEHRLDLYLRYRD